MVQITLFEIHLEESTFDATATAPSPFSGIFGDDAESEDDESEAETEAEATEANVTEAETSSGSRRPGAKGVLGGLLVLGLVAVAIRFLVSGDDIDELAETAAEITELDDESESSTVDAPAE